MIYCRACDYSHLTYLIYTIINSRLYLSSSELKTLIEFGIFVIYNYTIDILFFNFIILYIYITLLFCIIVHIEIYIENNASY